MSDHILLRKFHRIPKSPTGTMIRNINNMAVSPVSKSEVIEIIKKNLQNNSPGWDSILANPHLIKPLTHIIYLSITQGIFPKELKLDKIIPLFKTGDRMIFSNYRPVLVLPLVATILANLMYTRLLSFINKYKLLYSYQFRFCRAILLIWPWLVW